MTITPDTPVTDFPGVGPARAKKLEKLGILRAADLLTYYPRDYEDRRQVYAIRQAPEGVRVCVRAMVAQRPRLSRVRKGLDLVQVPVVDQGGTLHLTFFNQSYVERALLPGEDPRLEGLACPYLITFHDGFQYFADAFGLELLFAMEEEDGATASARDILTASQLVREYDLPVVFTERNGSGAAAKAVSGETGVRVDTLSMLMDGPDAPEGGAVAVLRATYLALMDENITTLAEVLK